MAQKANELKGNYNTDTREETNARIAELEALGQQYGIDVSAEVGAIRAQQAATDEKNARLAAAWEAQQQAGKMDASSAQELARQGNAEGKVAKEAEEYKRAQEQAAREKLANDQMEAAENKKTEAEYMDAARQGNANAGHEHDYVSQQDAMERAEQQRAQDRVDEYNRQQDIAQDYRVQESGPSLYTKYSGDTSSFSNPDVIYNVAKEAPGLTWYPTAGDDHWATEATAKLISDTANEWNKKHPDSPIAINDISQKGGGDHPDHASHENGNDMDIKWQAKDGTDPDAAKNGQLSGDYDVNPAYDAQKTQDMIEDFLKNAPADSTVTVRFGDASVIDKLKDKYGDAYKFKYDKTGVHDHHVHIGIDYN